MPRTDPADPADPFAATGETPYEPVRCRCGHLSPLHTPHPTGARTSCSASTCNCKTFTPEDDDMTGEAPGRTDWNRFRECPACHAEAGQPCKRGEGVVAGGAVTEIRLSVRAEPHTRRTTRAGGA